MGHNVMRGVTTDPEVPSLYKRIKSITFNNNCYYTIPNFLLTGADTLRFSFMVTADACNVLGSYSSYNTGVNALNYSLYVGNAVSARYLRYKDGAYISQALPNKRYDVEIGPTGTIGLEVNSNWTEQNFTTANDFCIGTTFPGATSPKLIGTLFGNVEVVGRAKCVPVRRVVDGVVGYYEVYSGTFLEPIGSNPVAGDDIRVMSGITLMLRRRLMKLNKNRVPVGFQEVEYLESSGNPIIDSGYVPKMTATHELIAKFSPLTSTGIKILLSCPTKFPGTNPYSARLQFPAKDGVFYSQANGSHDWSILPNFGLLTEGSIYTLTIANMTANCNNANCPVASIAQNNNDSLQIFGTRGDGASTAYIGRIYGLIYKIGGVKQMELVPCYRISDNKPGLYDIIRDVFLTSFMSGTDFTCGPNVVT